VCYDQNGKYGKSKSGEKDRVRVKGRTQKRWGDALLLAMHFSQETGSPPLFKGGLGEDVEELDGYGLKIRIRRKGRTEIFLVIIKTSPAARITMYLFILEHKCYEHITNV
jgi:hypothetical protein